MPTHVVSLRHDECADLVNGGVGRQCGLDAAVRRNAERDGSEGHGQREAELGFEGAVAFSLTQQQRSAQPAVFEPRVCAKRCRGKTGVRRFRRSQLVDGEFGLHVWRGQRSADVNAQRGETLRLGCADRAEQPKREVRDLDMGRKLVIAQRT